MDTTLIAPLEKIAVYFGIPWGWLALGVTWIVGVVNSAKVLVPNWIQCQWWIIINIAASILYAVATLSGWRAKIVGALALVLISWGAWIAAKSGAAKIGAREK